jgi:hypothetical protein
MTYLILLDKIYKTLKMRGLVLLLSLPRQKK